VYAERKKCEMEKYLGMHLSYRKTYVPSRKKKAAAFAAAWGRLLLAEGLAVSALIHGRVLLMGAHQDLVQRTVVLGVAVIGTGLDGAFDALVGVAVHDIDLLFLCSEIV
jgi:hypothetical protein